MEKWMGLQKEIGYTFRNSELLKEAITHKSYLNEIRDTGGRDNERLEFLGDAVLDLATSEHLIAIYPFSAEGELSKRKARIVNERALSRVARRLTLGQHLLLGKGEELTHGREKPSLLADALEAVIAAIYLDGGLVAARKFVLETFSEEFQALGQSEELLDYKTELQEYCQREWDILPRYRVLQESGPDHQKTFEVELGIRDRVLGIGKGKSKKEAEQQAAKEALEKVIKNT